MKKITINEIAERAGVSKTTVSFYLNGKVNKMSEETKERIQRIIDDTGYEPSAAARSMKAKSTGIIGVIVEDLSDPFCARALKGIEEIAGAEGYQLLVGSSDFNFNHEKDHVERMLKAGAEGFIVQATYRFGMIANTLEKKQKPIIYLDAKPYDYKGRCVKSNNYDCVYQVITDCIGRGYESFIMIAEDGSEAGASFENTHGFKDAIHDAGMSAVSHYLPRESKSGEIFELIRPDLVPDVRTLVYAASPRLFPAVFQSIRRCEDYQRLIPWNIGLVGIDLEGWTRLTTPQVTAIITPAYQEGERAAEELVCSLDGKRSEGEVVFKNIVKWRETVSEPV